MPSLHSNSLSSFHEFIGRQLASESTAPMSPEEALARWREFDETVAAVKEGLADVDAGRTRSADLVLRELREELTEL